MAKMAKTTPRRLPMAIKIFDMRRLFGLDDLRYLIYILIQSNDSRYMYDVEHYESKKSYKGGFRTWFILLLKSSGAVG